jgi:hypothetical protein
MSTEAQVHANRRNAEKSTGPRAEEGKAVVSRNALKHGLSAEREVLSFEDRAEYELHRSKRCWPGRSSACPGGCEGPTGCKMP